MASATHQLTELAGQWRDARRLYVLYGALQQKFDLGVPPCPELESPINRAEPEAMERVWNWFKQMDERVHVHQLRQLLQTTRLGTEENLRVMIARHLEKESKVDADRDKVDFLLVQYLGAVAPPGFYDKPVSFEDCAATLEPVIGEVGMHTPKWLEPLDQCLIEIEHCQSIRELLSKGILDETRLLKVSSGEMYFGPTALVAITRFNFLARRGFVRMIAADLHAIRTTLRDLEVNGVAAIDCSKAGLSDKETIEHLRSICHEWKKAFHAAYAAGQSFKQLVDVRTIVEDRLNQVLAEKLQREEQEKAHAAAAEQTRKAMEEKARLEAEEIARRDAEKQARLDAEAHAKRELEERERHESQAKREAEERERLAAEESARQQAEERARKEAEEAERQRQEREWLEADAKAKRENEEAEHLDAYERAIRDAEEKDKHQAEEKARRAREAEEQAKRDTEEKVRREEEDCKRKEKEEYEAEFARLEAEENERKGAEAKPAQESEQAPKITAEAARPKTQEELELEAYEAAIKAAEAQIGPPAPVGAGGGAAAAPALATREIDSYRTQIQEQITTLAPRQGGVATIVIGPLKLLLSSWEVTAFATGADVTADVLRRAVAARAVLLTAIDQSKYSGNTEPLRAALWQAQVEAEKIQAQIAVAKAMNDIDAACNLAATTKRLMALVDEAGKLK
ncbi:MAG: hypothetical protein ACJ71N_13350 [Terriglobales bacterium]|jgi:hypothetical protein